MIARVAAVVTCWNLVASACLPALAEDKVPMAYRYWRSEPWLDHLGANASPVEAYLTFDACYEFWNPSFCREVGIEDQAFSEPPRSPGQLGDHGPDDETEILWIFSQRVLTEADTSRFGDERWWARSGYVEMKVGYTVCPAPLQSDPCDAPPRKHEDAAYHRWVYLKPVGVGWHIAGWVSGTGNEDCYLDDRESPNYRKECDLMIDSSEHAEAVSK